MRLIVNLSSGNSITSVQAVCAAGRYGSGSAGGFIHKLTRGELTSEDQGMCGVVARPGNTAFVLPMLEPATGPQ